MGTNHEYNEKLRRESLKRTARIHRMRRAGMAWQTIAEQLGLSRQRVQQLAAKELK